MQKLSISVLKLQSTFYYMHKLLRKLFPLFGIMFRWMSLWLLGYDKIHKSLKDNLNIFKETLRSDNAKLAKHPARLALDLKEIAQPVNHLNSSQLQTPVMRDVLLGFGGMFQIIFVNLVHHLARTANWAQIDVSPAHLTFSLTWPLAYQIALQDIGVF